MKKILVISLLFVIILMLSSCGTRSTATPTGATAGTGSTGTYATPAPPVNTDGAETKVVPGRAYILGSAPIDYMAQSQEQPEHKVLLTGFNIYTHEVTNKLYKDCVDAGNCLAVSGLRPDLADYADSEAFDEYPVVGVDWFMAKAYCEWAGGRLPTEAEWEAAARGTDSRIYPWGNDVATCMNAGMRGCGTSELPFRVGSYSTGNSPFEVWDMAGNVWEWTNDWFDANYYATDPSTDPSGPWSGDYKIIRGGGWNSANDKVRSANRFAIDPSLSFKDVGFRCVANDWAVAPNVSIPVESHGRRGGDGRSVEDGPGTPPTEFRFSTYGAPRAVCGSGDTIVFAVSARNSFGATYSAELDGNPMSCMYSGGYLLCLAPRRTAATLHFGRLVYMVTVHMVDAGGTRLPDATYGASFIFGGSHFSSCTDSSSVEVTHRENAVCGSAPGPARVVTTVVSLDIIPGHIYLNDTALSGCIPGSGSMFLCPVPDSVAAGAATLHVVGALTDGVQPVDYTGAVTIPDCSTPPVTGDPVFNFAATCGTGGRFNLDITYTPTRINIASVLFGSHAARCLLVVPGQVRCNVGPEDVTHDADGTDYFTPWVTLDPGFPTPGGSLLVEVGSRVNVPTCPGSDTPTENRPLLFIDARCHPTGSGFEAIISTLGYLDYRSLSVRTGGMDTPCTPDAFNPSNWHCTVPNPVPTDLQFCYRTISGLEQCTSFEHERLISAMPTRCGGTTANDRWSISVGCENHTSDDNLIVTAGLVGGATPVDIKAGYRTTTWYGTPDPGMPGFYRFVVPRTFITSNLVFTATFSDSSQVFHEENIGGAAPATCKDQGSPGTGGLCADNPSISGWQNYANQYDVNNDGCVTDQDIEVIYNFRTAHPGESALPVPRPAGSAFVDVSGDGNFTNTDGFMVIQYMMDHQGVSCTSTCAPNGPSTAGEWTLTGHCAPNYVRAGWYELRAHFPGERTNINMFGRASSYCTLGADFANGTISLYCDPSVNFDNPVIFQIGRTDGTTDSHTFENPGAVLDFTCEGRGTRPDMKVIASCSTSLAGTYDLDIVYSPPSYTIYAIYDAEGRVLAQCGSCDSGHCHCDGVPASSDGLIHINVDDRTGTTEVMYPQVIAPPACGNNPNVGGWGFSATCEPSYPNFINCVITYPTTLGILPVVDNERPGWTATLLDLSGAGNTINCGFDRSQAGPGPLTWHFVGPSPDYAPIYHTFTEFPGVIPSVESCTGNSSTFPTELSCNANGSTDVLITMPAGWVLDHLNTSNGWMDWTTDNLPDGRIHLNGSQANLGGNFTFNILAVNASGVFGTYPVTIHPLECGGNTPAGWSFTPPICAEGGGRIEFNVDHPSSLNITAASGQNLSTSYACGIVNPTRLFCMGRASTSLATLTINYTLADGTTGSVDFGTIAAVTPAYCPTPSAPGGGGQTTCSSITDSNICGTSGCYWWWSDNTCHNVPDCNWLYGGDEKNCNNDPYCQFDKGKGQCYNK